MKKNIIGFLIREKGTKARLVCDSHRIPNKTANPVLTDDNKLAVIYKSKMEAETAIKDLTALSTNLEVIELVDPPNYILTLAIHKQAFDVMVIGEKKKEFREPSDWILSRLKNPKYTHIKFVNGYGSKRPFFIVELNGWETGFQGESDTQWFEYSNGSKVGVDPWDIVIHLGEIVKTGNL